MAKARREARKQFWSRVEQEGRQEQAEAIWNQLRAAGHSKRAVQAQLVAMFQPLDGNPTRAWVTPDSWVCGRQDAKKPPPDSQEQLERDAEWVHNNLGRPLEEAPTCGTRLLLLTAKDRPAEFLRIYLKCLPGITARQQEQVQARRRRVAERREAGRRQVEAQKRALAEQEAKQRAEAKRQAEEEARRRAEVQREAERLMCEQALATMQETLAVSPYTGRNWEKL
jgi:hypothetical protein